MSFLYFCWVNLFVNDNNKMRVQINMIIISVSGEAQKQSVTYLKKCSMWVIFVNNNAVL